ARDFCADLMCHSPSQTFRSRFHADDGTTRVPHRAELNKSQRILDELRRRSADPARPPGERDYLRRLLRQF
ncbi:MAG: DUF4175 family protein, partial [Alphaproteobacteria bacterium]|nr:DUF4175 family protein [Alphaproteobacteria bacterium]